MAQQVSPSNPLQVRSLEKWKRVFQDELDMKENEEFLILKTSMCGWWYAVNKKQEDGLIPYMYLEILSDYVDYTTITQHEFAHLEKTVLGWDIHNICRLIFQDQKSTTQEQNILLHSLRNLYIMCQKQDCRYTFLSKGGLDRLEEILQKTFDIAIRTFCLRAMILLAPSIEARRFPAQSNLTEGILNVMKEYMDMPSFVCICTDALSNVAFQNERQRMLAAKTNAVEMLLYAMDRHQAIFKVQLQASRSLANMASDPKIQRQIDDKGVQTLLNSLNAVFGAEAVQASIQNQQMQDQNARQNNQYQQQQMNQGVGGGLFDAKKGQFAQQMLVIISYITQDPRKAQAFGRLGGWQALKTIQMTIGVWDEAVRQTIIGMLNTMSQNPAIAKCFFDNNYEGYDILFDMCLEAEPYSLYFYQIFCIITFITCKCDKQQLPQVVIHAFDRKQLARLMNDALQQHDNERLMDTVPTLTALTVRTKDEQAQNYIYNSMVPMHLLKICANQPGAPNDQFLNYTLITIYNLTMDEERVDSFIQNGVIEAIAGASWYQDPHKEQGITQNGLVSLVNVCSRTKRRLLPQQESLIQNMIQVCHQVHPKLKPVIQKLDVALKKAQAASGNKPKKKRMALNKKGNKNQKRNKNQQGPGPVPQGAWDPNTGSYQGQQNAQKPDNYNPQQQQQGGYNPNEYQGPVQGGLVERPYQDEDNNNNYGRQSQYSSNPRNNYNPYGSQANFGGNNNQNPYQSQSNFNNQNQYGSQANFGGNNGPNNQNPYGSQANFNNNQNPYQSQNNFNNNQNPYQSQSNFNNPQNNNNQNPYQSQSNFNNQNNFGNNNNMQNNYGGPNNNNNQQQQGNLYGNDKWETDSDDDGNGDDSSSEDEWEKQKKAKVMQASQVNVLQGQNNNNNQPPPQQQQQQYGSQMNMNNNMGGNNGGYNGSQMNMNNNNMGPNNGGYNGGYNGSQRNFNNNMAPNNGAYPAQGYGSQNNQGWNNQPQQGYGSQINMNNNMGGNNGGYGGPQQQQQYGSQMNMNNNMGPNNGGYNGSQMNMGGGQQQQQQYNSALNDSSDDEDIQAQNNNYGWSGHPDQQQQQQQQQQQPVYNQNPSGMSKQSIASWNDHSGANQPRDYMGFNQMQQRQNQGGGGQPQQMQQPPQQQQQQQAPPQQQQGGGGGGGGGKGKKKKKFKLFG